MYDSDTLLSVSVLVSIVNTLLLTNRVEIIGVKKPSVKRASIIYSISSVTQSGIELMSVKPKKSDAVIKDRVLISQLNN